MTSPSDSARHTPFDDAFLASLSRLAFAVARQRAREGEGVARVDLRGGRVEFADHRPYAPGDDPRFVDWAVYARTGRFFVKEFERHEELSLLLLVDDSGSMALHGKLLTAQRLAYALAYVGLAGGNRVRAGFCADGALRLSGEVAVTLRIDELGAFLAGAQGRGETRLGESLRAVPGAARGSRVVVLVSDLLAQDDGRRALAVLARRGDDVDVLHVWAAADLALPEVAYVVVEDAETGERLALPPGAAAEAGRYAARREEDWRAFATRHRVRYVPLDAAAPTEELVLRSLRAGGVLR